MHSFSNVDYVRRNQYLLMAETKKSPNFLDFINKTGLKINEPETFNYLSWDERNLLILLFNTNMY